MYCELPIWGVKCQNSDEVYCSKLTLAQAEVQWKRKFRTNKGVVFTKENLNAADLRLRHQESESQRLRDMDGPVKAVVDPAQVRDRGEDPLSLL